MNIFVTDRCPKLSAQALDNKRIVKMVLETAQLLSTAIFINSGNIYDNIYKPTHLKHPCTIWAAKSSGNWDWLLEHFIALYEEYNLRYKKQHASTKLLPFFFKHRAKLKKGSRTAFANCTKSESLKINFKNVKNIYQAYRKYLNAKWHCDKLRPKWVNREPPKWYNTIRVEKTIT